VHPTRHDENNDAGVEPEIIDVLQLSLSVDVPISNNNE
jgi:hypothetical protein